MIGYFNKSCLISMMRSKAKAVIHTKKLQLVILARRGRCLVVLWIEHVDILNTLRLDDGVVLFLC